MRTLVNINRNNYKWDLRADVSSRSYNLMYVIILGVRNKLFTSNEEAKKETAQKNGK